jgi:tRNA-Thr(GGU) m(6)t(6)A37 methyltransferase TsaA
MAPSSAMQPPVPTLTLTPIGLVHSPWQDKRSAPRQPAAARGVAGRIELTAGASFADALADLAGWSHIWVLFWFHLNRGWRPKVLPPRSQQKRGVFSTRSPYRPNPIGMSVLRLERIEGTTLYVRDLDILDQTPVLDIKPYVAYTDAIPGAGDGWLEDDVAVDSGPTYEVELVERAPEQLAFLKPLAACDIESLARSVLRAGPAPHAYRRIRAYGDHSVLAVKDFRLRFRVAGNLIQVFDVQSGYRARVLDDPRSVATEATPLDVHRAFVARFGRDR